MKQPVEYWKDAGKQDTSVLDKNYVICVFSLHILAPTKKDNVLFYMLFIIHMTQEVRVAKVKHYSQPH